MSWVGGRGRVVRRRVGALPARDEVGTWDQCVDDSAMGGRSYAVYTPAGLDPRRAVPLVVVLHGCKQSAWDAALGTGVNALADRAGFVALYPEQSDADNMRRCWNWFDPRHQARGSGEPQAIARITEQVLSGRSGVTLDRNRVHAMGISAGGAMAGILAATYPDLYASVGIHSAPQYRAAKGVLSAMLAMKTGGPDPERQGQFAYDAMGPRARVVPVIVFQGQVDRTVWSGNGERVIRQWLATSRLASGKGTGSGEEAELDFARPHATLNDTAPGGLSYSVRSWHDKAGLPVAQLWAVADLGHAWSGGSGDSSYTDSRGPNATQAMYAFFATCPMGRDEIADVPAGKRMGALGRTVRKLGLRWGRRGRMLPHLTPSRG